jgi:hypothetical protein
MTPGGKQRKILMRLDLTEEAFPIPAWSIMKTLI